MAETLAKDNDSIQWGWVDRYFVLRGVWRGSRGDLEPMQRRAQAVLSRLRTTTVIVGANLGAVYASLLFLYLAAILNSFS
jgi:hypothetical protein